MSKSIVSQVRSMAQEKMNKRIDSCADRILAEMSKKFKSYMVVNDFPTVYKAEVTLVLESRETDFTPLEIQTACNNLGLLYKTDLDRHFITMTRFISGVGLKMTEPQKLYKKMRTKIRKKVIEEEKKTRIELKAARESIKIQTAQNIQQAKIQADEYLAQVLNQLKAGNFSTMQILLDKYRINVPVRFPGELDFITTIQEKEVYKAFKKHRFVLVSLDKSHCECDISTH